MNEHYLIAWSDVADVCRIELEIYAAAAEVVDDVIPRVGRILFDHLERKFATFASLRRVLPSPQLDAYQAFAWINGRDREEPIRLVSSVVPWHLLVTVKAITPPAGAWSDCPSTTNDFNFITDVTAARFNSQTLIVANEGAQRVKDSDILYNYDAGLKKILNANGQMTIDSTAVVGNGTVDQDSDGPVPWTKLATLAEQYAGRRGGLAIVPSSELNRA
ncbi:MAG TPA: hypothetical protein VD994_20160 [Prosthecobacter sp.]|nr:hypothetical protein [Candidatus Limnocylindrales bacterium]HYF37627.1 hypothetical protein [Prosthecobacter sp.]